MKFKVTVLIAVAALSLLGCMTTKVQVIQKPTAPLAGVKAVVADVVMTQRTVPMFPLIDAGIYRAAVNNAEAQLKAVDETKTSEMGSVLETSYKDTFGAEVIRGAAPFAGPLTPGFYAAPTADAVSRIADEATAYGADLVVIPTARVVTTGVSGFGIIGYTYAGLDLFVFDKSGKLVASGQLMTNVKGFAAQDMASYGTILDEARVLIPDLIKALNK